MDFSQTFAILFTLPLSHCTGYAPAENDDWILFDLGDWVMLRVIGNCVKLFLVARLF